MPALPVVFPRNRGEDSCARGSASDLTGENEAISEDR